MAVKISVGPIPYFWDRDTVYAFYDLLQNAPVDVIYLGETVCSKRRQLELRDWVQIGRPLAAAGKEVILSTLTLFEVESELAALGRIVDNAQFMVEANDMAAVHLLANRHPFVAGPHLNVYNIETLRLLHELGARRWVIPVELGRETIQELQRLRPRDMEFEMFAFGRLPLAFSARCYTARAHNRPKDKCDFLCLDYPEGMPLFTQQQQPFLVLNGIQTQSIRIQNLITLLDRLAELEIDVIRIMPQSSGLVSVATVFRETLDGTISGSAALAMLEPYQSYGYCNGYWYGKEGMDWVEDNAG